MPCPDVEISESRQSSPVRTTFRAGVCIESGYCLFRVRGVCHTPDPDPDVGMYIHHAARLEDAYSVCFIHTFKVTFNLTTYKLMFTVARTTVGST